MSEASISKIERIPVSFSRQNSMELICGRIKAASFQIRIVFPFALFFLSCACLFPHAGVGGYRGGGGRGYFLRRGSVWGCATRWDRFFPPGLTGNGVAVSIELLEFSVSGFTALEWKEGRFVWNPPGWGGGGTWVNFSGYVPLASQSPHPFTIYSVASYRRLVTFGQICNFRDPILVTFSLCIFLINPLNGSSENELTHFLNWMKNTLLFSYSTNILVRFCQP